MRTVHALMAVLLVALACVAFASPAGEAQKTVPPAPVAQAAPAVPEAPAAKVSIDIATCRNCHEQQVSMLERTYHGKIMNSCENCHGTELVKHATTGELTAVSLKTAKPEKVVATCLKCHDKGRQANWTGGMHERRGVACTNCHSIHDYKSVRAQIKTTSASETCFGCHPAIRALTQRTSHHPIREGRIGCENCHDPHDARSAKFLSVANVNEKCYTCHQEKRGPFLWEHAPVRENCLNCHNPHGSNHDKLLVAARPYLCQRCHSNTRHPGTLYDLRATPAAGIATANNRDFNRSCQNCHANIHGSNAPSGPYFGR